MTDKMHGLGFPADANFHVLKIANARRPAECLRKGKPFDQMLDMGCFWSAVTPLGENHRAKDK